MHVILDIDGTLSDASHRAHHLNSNPKNWEAFLAPDTVSKDIPIPGAVEAVRKMVALNYHLTFLTGRNESLRDVTSTWLLNHFDFATNDFNLLMRPVSNMLKAAEYKAQQMQVLLAEFKAGGANDFVFIDDDPQVFDVYAAEGLILKAPDCWKILFPSKPEAGEENV